MKVQRREQASRYTSTTVIFVVDTALAEQIREVTYHEKARGAERQFSTSCRPSNFLGEADV